MENKLLQSIKTIDSNKFINLLSKFQLTLPRSLMIGVMKDVLLPFVEADLQEVSSSVKTEEGLPLLHKLSRLTRLKLFTQWSQIQSLNEMGRYSDEHPELISVFYSAFIRALKRLNQGDNQLEFMESLDALLTDGEAEFFDFETFIIETFYLFYDDPDSLDGVPIKDFRSLMFSISTMEELKQLGSYYQVALPAYVSKDKVVERMLYDLEELSVLTPELKQRVEQSSLSQLRIIGDECNVNAKTYFLKTEAIEYILEHAKQSTYKYVKPVEKNVYYKDEIQSFDDYFLPLLNQDAQDMHPTLLQQAREAFNNLDPIVQRALAKYLPILFPVQQTVVEHMHIDQSQHTSNVTQSNTTQHTTIIQAAPEVPTHAPSPSVDLETIRAIVQQTLEQQNAAITAPIHARMDALSTQLSVIQAQANSQVYPAHTTDTPSSQEALHLMQATLVAQTEALKDACQCKESRKQRIGFIPLMLLVLNSLLIGSLLYFLFFGNGLQTGYLYVGTNRQLLVNEAINPSYPLIPKGASERDGHIDEFVYVFRPTFETEANVQTRVLEESIHIGDANNPFNDLLIIQLYTEDQPLHLTAVDSTEAQLIYNPEIQLYTINVYARVFIGEPDEEQFEEAYDAIAGKTIRFSLIFEINETN